MATADIIKAVASVAIALLTGFILPLLEAKHGTEKVKQGAAKFDAWTAMAEKAVDAAYQLFDTNEARKEYCVTTLEKLGVPANTINTVIEAAVKACKMAGTAIAAVKEVETATDKAINNTPAQGDSTSTLADQAAADAAVQAEKFAKLTAAAQALGVAVTPGMDTPALQTAITAAMAS